MVVGLTLFIAVCATCMTLGSIELMGAATDMPLLALVFSATLIIYTLDRLRPNVEDGADPSYRLRAYANAKTTIRVMLGAGILGAAAATPFQRPEVLLSLMPLGVVSIWYTVPAGRFLRLKDVPYIKTFVVAAVWTLVTAWLPVWRPGMVISAPLVAHLATRFLFLLAITLPFDYRDGERDRAAGVKTLPQLLGTTGTRTFCLVLLAMFVVAHSVYDPSGLFVPNALTAAVTAAVLIALNPARSDVYYAVGVDGTMMLQYALIMTFTAVR